MKQSKLGIFLSVVCLTYMNLSVAEDSKSILNFSKPISEAAKEYEEISKVSKSTDIGSFSEGFNLSDQLAFSIDSENDKLIYTNSFNHGDNFFGIRLEGGLDDSDELSLPVDLDGLSDAITFELGYTWSFFPEIRDVPLTIQRMNELCGAQNAINAAWNIAPENAGSPKRATLEKTKVEDDGVMKEFFINCDSSFVEDGLKEPFLLSALEDQSYKFIRASYRAGREQFGFADPMTLKTASQDSNVYSANLSAGIITAPTKLGNSPTLFQVTYRRERSFSESETQNICTESETTQSSLVCRNLKLGAPSQNDSDLLHFEMRKQFFSEDSNEATLAIAPKISFDLEKDIESVELPIWVPAGRISDKLDAGMVLGWRSDTDDISFGLFVSRSFSLIPK